jgi:virginiamycin A acetyltransferase
MVRTLPGLSVLRRMLKHACNLVALGVVSPCAIACWIERRWSGSSQAIFQLWTHVFALLPGPPGVFLRRAFYRWTLDHCAEEVVIEFGAVFTRRSARVERGVYVGPYALVGSAWLREDTLIGSRASLLSGGQQHELLPSGKWSGTKASNLVRIEIGPDAWVGEGAILMANVGRQCMVSAGAVVSTAVRDGIMVGGNPARFVRTLAAAPAVEEGVDAANASAIRRLA